MNVKDISSMSQGHIFRPDKGKASYTLSLIDLAFQFLSYHWYLSLVGLVSHLEAEISKLSMVSVKHLWFVGFQELHSIGQA